MHGLYITRENFNLKVFSYECACRKSGQLRRTEIHTAHTVNGNLKRKHETTTSAGKQATAIKRENMQPAPSVENRQQAKSARKYANCAKCFKRGNRRKGRENMQPAPSVENRQQAKSARKYANGAKCFKRGNRRKGRENMQTAPSVEKQATGEKGAKTCKRRQAWKTRQRTNSARIHANGTKHKKTRATSHDWF